MSNEEDAIAKLSIESVTSKRSYPAAVTLTGTISSTGTVVTGVGTLFLSEITSTVNPGILKYKYIYNSVTNEIREIASVQTDTTLTLVSAFAAPLSGVALTCPSNKFNYKEISVICAGASGVAATVGNAPVTLMQTSVFTFRWIGGVAPIAVDGTGSPLQITTML